MAESGFVTGRPLPMVTAFLMAIWTYSFAILHASSRVMPLAKYAVAVEEKLHPDPWLSLIFTRGLAIFVSLPLLSRSKSVTCDFPKWPPLTMTFSAPSFLILLAASIPSLSVLILVPASFSASILFGVIKEHVGISFETNES